MKYRNRETAEKEKINTRPNYNDIIEDYDFIRDEKGILKVQKVGEHSNKEYVNSFKEECSLQNQLEKIKLTGNISFLQQKQGIYADISEYPTDKLSKDEISQSISNYDKKLAELQKQLEELKATPTPKENTTNESK